MVWPAELCIRYETYNSEGLDSALSRIKEYSTPRRKRLLVVEDNLAEQLSIKELLGYDDIDVTVASTGAEAVEIANEQAFDCVVLDLRLPDISGFDVLERFSDIPSLRDLPVVVFTGKELSPEEDAACTRWPAALWSRAWSRRNVSWMRLRYSCTASSLICRRKSKDCLTACIIQTMPSLERKFWWWTMTCGTSSPSAA